MLKFVDTKVVFSEIPDEITLAINISGCPCACPGCHSSYLLQDVGESLTYNTLSHLIEINRGITCVLIMGGDSNPEYVDNLSGLVKSFGLKYAWYSGRENISDKISIANFDYIKVGPYIEALGALESKTTNQKMFKILDGNLSDITFLFQKTIK